MIRRMLMTVVCLAALAVAVPAAADPTDPAPTGPSISPSIGPTSESAVSTPAAPTQSSAEPISPPEPSGTASSSDASSASTTSAPSPVPGAGRTAAPTSQGTTAGGPTVLAAGDPPVLYPWATCAGQLSIYVGNPVTGTTYVYRLIAHPGTDPVELTGVVPTGDRPGIWLSDVPSGIYTVEVTGNDGSEALRVNITVPERCDDSPLIFFRTRHVPCGPGDDITGLTGYLENPRPGVVYTWVVHSEVPDDGIRMDPFTGPVEPDGTFTLTGLKPGTFSVIFRGDEEDSFESSSFAVYACPRPTSPPATPPPPSAVPSDSPPPSTTSSTTSSTPPQAIGSVDATTGATGELADTGSGPESLAFLGTGFLALLAGFVVLRGRVRPGRHG